MKIKDDYEEAREDMLLEFPYSLGCLSHVHFSLFCAILGGPIQSHFIFHVHDIFIEITNKVPNQSRRSRGAANGEDCACKQKSMKERTKGCHISFVLSLGFLWVVPPFQYRDGK